MSNADPENKVSDIEGPAHTVVRAPDANSYRDQPRNHASKVQQSGERESKTNPPTLARTTFQRPGNVVSDLAKGNVTVNPPWRRQDLRSDLRGLPGCDVCRSASAH